MSLEAKTTITAEELHKDTARATAAAAEAPVLITEGGKPAFVLLSHEEFLALQERHPRPGSVLSALADMRPEAKFRYEFERDRSQPRPVGFGEE
jgi:PHD/YefM family antitoxin component YafN of YafNO toxin-antitoxin module